MYFNEKENTNIDAEFAKENKLNLKLKPILIIVGIIVLIGIILFIVFSFANNNKYIIELTGEQEINIPLGQEYIEPGYKAYDKNKNDVTNQVVINSNVDTNTIGEYEVSYSLGRINKVRRVIVSEVNQVTYIILKGKVNMYLNVGDKYIEPGYEAHDSVDKDITKNVKVSGSVNTSKAGTYLIKYTVTNSKNVTTTVTRTVVVSAK